MGWLTIIMWLLSFFLAKNKGVSTGKAALLATGVAGATWLTLDPANPNSLWGSKMKNHLPDGFSDDLLGSPDSADAAAGGGSGGFGKNLTDLAGTTVTTVGDVAKSWGPVGTVGAVTAVKHEKGISSWLSNNQWVIYAGLGVAAFWLLSRDD